MTSILAISGGPDSVYLLHQLLNKGEHPILAHFNHQLRGTESDEDERFVKNLATQNNLILELNTANVALHAKTHKMSVETAGRTLRHEFLEKVRQKHNADHIYLAHHLNDNLETVLMNEQRGCHLRGRIGMLEKNGPLVRPLLNIPKTEILHYLKQHQIPYRIDASNQDTRTLRNHIRHLVIPDLLTKNPNLLQDFQTNRAHALDTYNSFLAQTESWLQENPDCPRKKFLTLTETQQQFLLQFQYQRAHGSTFNLTTPQIREVQKMIQTGHGGKQRTLGKNLLIRLEQGKILFKQNTLSNRD